MLADVQTDEEIRENARDIQGDQEDDEVVAPLAGEEDLELPPQAPEPGILTVHPQDVGADAVGALTEGGDEGGVGPEQWGGLAGRGIRAIRLAFHGWAGQAFFGSGNSDQ